MRELRPARLVHTRWPLTVFVKDALLKHKNLTRDNQRANLYVILKNGSPRRYAPRDDVDCAIKKDEGGVIVMMKILSLRYLSQLY